MCLISVLGKGTLKSGEVVESFIRNGMKSQQDGSGFAFKRNGEKTITLSKAYFNIDMMLKAIAEVNLTEDDEMIIHHRTSTGGNDELLNTHPFVITPKFEDITVIDTVTKKPVMAHNGIFSGYSEKVDKKFNDTVHWIQVWMTNPYFLTMIKNEPAKFKELYGTLSSLSYSKLAFIFPDKGIVTVGDFTEDGGYLHSNSCYKDYTRTDRGGVSGQRMIGFKSWDYDAGDEDYNNLYVHKKDNNSFIKTNECWDKFGIVKKEFKPNSNEFSIVTSEKFLKLTRNTMHCYIFKQIAGSNGSYYHIKNESDIGNIRTTLTCVTDDKLRIELNTESLVNGWQVRVVKTKYEDIFNDIYLLKKTFGDKPSNKKKKKLINWYNTSFNKKRPKVKLNGKTDMALVVSTVSLGLYLDNLITTKSHNTLEVVN
jgi:hypothetical protein